MMHSRLVKLLVTWIALLAVPQAALCQYRSTAKATTATISIMDDDGVRQTIRGKQIDGAFVYQGDMVLVPAGVSLASGVRKFLRWSNGVIPYTIASNHPYKAKIEAAIQALNASTVLWYKPTRNFGAPHIYIGYGNGCHSEIGEPIISDRVKVSIGQDCDRHGTIIHELLHAAGLNHEQARQDRDSYVNIYWQNIDPGKQDNFDKGSWSKDIGPYNFASVMHYDCRDFANHPNVLTIKPKAGFPQLVGQRTGLSVGDVSAIAAMYNTLISDNRGKPSFTPQALPTPIYSSECQLPPQSQSPPASTQQCNSWRAKLMFLRSERDSSTDIQERKRFADAASALEMKMRAGGCSF